MPAKELGFRFKTSSKYAPLLVTVSGEPSQNRSACDPLEVQSKNMAIRSGDGVEIANELPNSAETGGDLQVNGRKRRDSMLNDPSDTCRLERMPVKLNLTTYSWIIKPRSFDAQQCVGQCHLNHLTARHHFNEYGQIKAALRNGPLGQHLRPFTCVETSFESLLVLIYDGQNLKFKLQLLKNMIATGCGCK